MHRTMASIVLTLLLATVAQAQSREQLAQNQLDTLLQAQQVLAAAENAGAAVYARSLYEDAQLRVKAAQENWNSDKRGTREKARLRAREALWAARAALAKAQWLSTNAAIRSLQSDITRFGGRSDLALVDESPAIEFARGSNSKQRIDFAQATIDQAKASGAQQFAAADLTEAETLLSTARKIARGDSTSESADHLAYVAEMMARRAYYVARANDVNRNLPMLQFERTRLAQEASERQAAAERAQREAAERQAAELNRQLAMEESSRRAQAAELDSLRMQVEDNRRLMDQRLEQDRLARVEAERQLDEAVRRYEMAIGTSTAEQVDTLRRQVEDQQIALRAIQERERLNEQTMAAEIEGLRSQLDQARTQGSINTQVLSEREAELQRRQQELDRLRVEREDDLSRRLELDRRQQSAIVEATTKRQEAEAAAQELRVQIELAQQQAVQRQAELDRAREQASQTQAELDRTRQELAMRDAESRRLRMQQELARLATTRTDSRGLIVTLPGIFFDTGKSQLKPGARNTLTKIADQLKNEASVRIAVEGHTDSVGSEESNQNLSEARANAVRDFLVNAGLSADRISASGEGEGTPVATNNTAAGRQQNRRVELVITTAP